MACSDGHGVACCTIGGSVGCAPWNTRLQSPSLCVTFGVYRFWRAYIDGYSALCVVYEVSLEVVMTTRA